jgi:hypothetical protein
MNKYLVGCFGARRKIVVARQAKQVYHIRKGTRRMAILFPINLGLKSPTNAGDFCFLLAFLAEN